MALGGTERRKYFKTRDAKKEKKKFGLSQSELDALKRSGSPEEQLARAFGSSKQAEKIRVGAARKTDKKKTFKQSDYDSSFGATRRTGGGTKSFGPGGDTSSRARTFGQPRDTGGGKKAFGGK